MRINNFLHCLIARFHHSFYVILDFTSFPLSSKYPNGFYCIKTKKSDPLYLLSLSQQIQHKILLLYHSPCHNIIPVVRNWCIHSGEHKIWLKSGLLQSGGYCEAAGWEECFNQYFSNFFFNFFFSILDLRSLFSFFYFGNFWATTKMRPINIKHNTYSCNKPRYLKFPNRIFKKIHIS